MAPVLKSYGKKETRKKEDTFDRLFNTFRTDNVFDSSSDKDKSKPESVKGKSSLSIDVEKSKFFSIASANSSIETENSTSDRKNVLSIDPFDVSDLTPVPAALQKIKDKRSKVHKTRASSRKKKLPSQLKNTLKKESCLSLVSSTPKFAGLNLPNALVRIDKDVSPIETTIASEKFYSLDSSPKGLVTGGFKPKNILSSSHATNNKSSKQTSLSSKVFSSCDVSEFHGFSLSSINYPNEKLQQIEAITELVKNISPDSAITNNNRASSSSSTSPLNVTGDKNVYQSTLEKTYSINSSVDLKRDEIRPVNTLDVSNDSNSRAGKLPRDSSDFLGFPTPSRDFSLIKVQIQEIQERLEDIVSPKAETSNRSSNTSAKSDSVLDQTDLHSEPLIISSKTIKSLSISNKISEKHSNDESLSRSMQNLNISEKDYKVIVKSSSFDEIKPKRVEESNPSLCKINIQPATTDFNIDSSDIEESAVNSADERSYSLRSGQLDEEESAFHSSDDENESGISKDKDSSELTHQKTGSKGDSESAIFSAPNRDASCNNQSGDVSADDCDLYTESEIAKSSDSIEVSKAVNIENVSSDLSTSSDKEIMKDDEYVNTTSQNVNLNICDKTDNSKQTIGFIQTRSSTKSKDSSFYSLENSASDDSEFSFESDSELSCESSRSSRKSSLDSTLSKEALEQLRESVSLIKVQDEYEDALCSKSRKSLSKRSADWDCPPSPRRSLFPLAPLFPLPENQEDPADDPCQSHSGSMCDSTTASEEDSHHSNTRKSRGKLKEALLRKREESGVEGRSSGEDESSKSSPVRETTRLRRSRRISKKRESNSRLNMVIEESDSESAEADIVPQMEHIILPTGKKYRRSLSIIKHLGEETINLPPYRGRNYDQSVDSVIKLQSKTGFESPRDGRKSLLIKRRSLLSQCQSPSSPTFGVSRSSVDLFTSLLVEGSPLSHLKSFRKLSVSTKDDKMDRTVSRYLSKTETTLRHLIEEEEEEEEVEGKEEERELEDSLVKETTLLHCERSSSETQDNDLSFPSESEQFDSVMTEEYYESLVMKCCGQTEPLKFSDILPKNWFEGSSKVGEGVYGEVFMIPRDNCKNVLKIIPIEGSLIVNEEKQKTYAEIANELLITFVMSGLRDENEDFMTFGFVEIVQASVVKGRYPKKLVELWNEFDLRKGSDNDNPKIFGSDQLYLVLELGNAGTDLESYSFSTAKQGLSIFKQTVCALAVAEAQSEFEHRDLHWGNVLVSRTSERDIPFVLNKEKYTILSNGVKATIIDFTLSRMSLPRFPIYYDIGQDPDMFIGTGDYQFDVYRQMKEDVQNNWRSFVPKTNVRWLHYLVDKMIGKVRYQRKTAKVHTDSMKILKDIESWILSCDNAVQVALRVVQYK